jgi:hypothetical protein
MFALFDPVLRDENDLSTGSVLPVEEQWYDDQYNEGDGDDLQQQQVDEYTETTMPMNTRTILMKITDRKQN